jgi:hypothetical protein
MDEGTGESKAFIFSPGEHFVVNTGQAMADV